MIALFMVALSAPVDVQIAWDYKDVPATMQIYEPAAQIPVEVWQMGEGKTLADLPIAKMPIEASTLHMATGSSKVFVLVMQNPGNKPVHFFAAPHAVTPPELSLGFKFHCLCVNHVFEIPPGGYWYRVVQLDLHPGFVGKRIEVRHVLVGVPGDRTLEPMAGHEHHEMP